MLQRKSDFFLACLALGGLMIGLIFIDSAVRRRLGAPLLAQRSAIVRVLRLSDLALFTEARYTRHPSMADRFAPFQEHPLSLEHFPSGTLVPVPPHLRSGKGR